VICPNCQTMNEQRSAFCGKCGTALARTPPSDSRGFAPSAMPPGPAPGAPDRSAAPGPYGGQPGPYGGQPGPYGGQPGPYGGQPGPYTKATQPSSREFRLDLRRLSRVDQVVGGATLIVFISLFLPWFGISGFGGSFTVSGTSAHGYLAIAVILALLMMAYLVLVAGWDEFPVNLPIAHAPLLLIGTGLQFLLVLIGFVFKPDPGLSWEIGAYLGLLAAAVAAAPVVIPAIRSLQQSSR
jgi:hypothetical protein